MDVIRKIQKVISYWYVRYLLTIELYMVDTWEQMVVHATFAVFFLLFWYFNYSIVTSCVAQLRLNTSSQNVEQIL